MIIVRGVHVWALENVIIVTFDVEGLYVGTSFQEPFTIAFERLFSECMAKWLEFRHYNFPCWVHDLVPRVNNHFLP